MNKVILFDKSDRRIKLRPLSFTRPIADFRLGILTIKEKWLYHFTTVELITDSYLAVNADLAPEEDYLFVDSAICPTITFTNVVNGLTNGQSVKKNGETLAFVGTLNDLNTSSYLTFKAQEFVEELTIIECNSDIFSKNGIEIKEDFKKITLEKKSEEIDQYSMHIGEELFIAKGAKISAAVLNTTQGPIFIDEGAEVMEGAILRGPLSIGKNAVVKMGAKIYGDTTIGPSCKVGGEVGNSVLFGFSNKGHDGYLGNSVLGEWCNLGADTNTSNLKNNYGSVKTWDYSANAFSDTGLTFHGLIMGDHSKSGINTMFNTGTIVGVCCNIYGGGFPDKFIPSFSWGGNEGFVTYDLNKAIDTASVVYGRRKRAFGESEKAILQHIFKISESNRT